MRSLRSPTRRVLLSIHPAKWSCSSEFDRSESDSRWTIHADTYGPELPVSSWTHATSVSSTVVTSEAICSSNTLFNKHGIKRLLLALPFLRTHVDHEVDHLVGDVEIGVVLNYGNGAEVQTQSLDGLVEVRQHLLVLVRLAETN